MIRILGLFQQTCVDMNLQHKAYFYTELKQVSRGTCSTCQWTQTMTYELLHLFSEVNLEMFSLVSKIRINKKNWTFGLVGNGWTFSKVGRRTELSSTY